MSPPKLPYDVLERCMEFVPDMATLISCVHAGQFLRHPSQRFLFAAPCFYDLRQLNHVQKRWKSFGAALGTPSDLGRHVKLLGVQSILLNDDSISSVFSQTRNLTRLDISEMSQEYGPLPLPWAELHLETKRVLSEKVFPHLTELRFGDLKDIPAVIFEYLPSLQFLDSSIHILPLDPDFPIDSKPNPRPLVHLTLHDCFNGPWKQTIEPLVDYLVRYQCRLQELNLQMNLVDPSMSYLTRLIVPSKTSLRTLSCERLDYFIYCLEDAAYNPASQDFFNLNQYSSLTTFNSKLNLEHYEPLEMEQVLRPFSMILQSGRQTPTCTGLQTVSMQLEFSFAVGDTNDPPMWSPIVEALDTISTLENVDLVIRLCPKDERKWSFYDVSIMPMDRAEFFRYLPWKLCLEEALDKVGLLKITRVTYQLEGIDFE